MRKLLLPILAGCVLAVSGCARNYVIKLSTGRQVTTASKPRLKGATYYFKDAQGKEQSIPAGRVAEIMPASMAQEEKPRFIPSAK